jgi:hypothetical protein
VVSLATKPLLVVCYVEETLSTIRAVYGKSGGCFTEVMAPAADDWDPIQVYVSQELVRNVKDVKWHVSLGNLPVRSTPGVNGATDKAPQDAGKRRTRHVSVHRWHQNRLRQNPGVAHLITTGCSTYSSATSGCSTFSLVQGVPTYLKFCTTLHRAYY